MRTTPPAKAFVGSAEASLQRGRTRGFECKLSKSAPCSAGASVKYKATGCTGVGILPHLGTF